MKNSLWSLPVLAAVASTALAQTNTTTTNVTVTDTDILNYALTLEHLENAFYAGALEQYNATDFEDAGFESWVHGRFLEIQSHEASHVAFLTTALGANATQACNYTFPYTDPKSFAALSMVLEGVGVSAYLGAAAKITNKDYLTAAGSILTTESRHAAWVSAAVEKDAGWSGPYDTPLDLDQVYSLASAFITACPTTNPTLPVKAFPTLGVLNSTYAPGDMIALNFTNNSTEGTFLALYSGMLTTILAVDGNKMTTLPTNLQGTVYGVLSSSNASVTDDNTIAGPVILSFPFNSSAAN